MAIACVPQNLSGNVKDLISLKAFNLLSGEEGLVPKSLAIVPFPSQHLKGLIKSLEIQDKDRRGGIIDSSLAVLFNDANALLFYQNINNLETLFNEAATRIVNLVETRSTKQHIEEELKQFHDRLINAVVPTKAIPKIHRKSLLLLFNLFDKDLDKVLNAIILGDPIIVTGDRALVELIIDTLAIFFVDQTPKIEYWSEEFIKGDIIGGPSYLTHIFQTGLVLDVVKGKIIGGRSNNFCKRILKQAKQLDSSQGEEIIIQNIQKIFSVTNGLLDLVTKNKVTPSAIEKFVTDLEENELECIENYANLKHPEFSKKIIETISLCEKKMSKIYRGFERETW